MLNSSGAYFQRLQYGIQKRDGQSVANLLKFSDIHCQNSQLSIEYPENMVQKYIESPWDEIVAAHIRCIWCYNHQDIAGAYDCQTLIVQSFGRYFESLQNDNWSLPVMQALVVDLRRFAHLLDLQSAQKKSSAKFGEYLEKAASLIMTLFRTCASDSRSSPEESKKWGMMGLCNQLFKIYFQINKLNLCKPMIRAIDNMQTKERFSIAQKVTYNYYVGRKSMFEDNFRAAESCLEFAFNNCPVEFENNKRRILIYLIPVKMLLGIFPRTSALTKYKLHEFIGVLQAVKEGDVNRLNQELEKHQSFFIKCGIYLILEKLKTITYRNLFKKVYLILNSHLLPVGAFAEALNFLSNEQVDFDETQCILANLIYQDKIKGYLAHAQQKLVVSKQIAFPPLFSRQ